MKLFVICLSLLAFSSVNGTYCGSSQYNSDTGTISLSNYGRGANCEYNIRLTNKNRWIKLTWSHFNVDGDMPTCKDYVKIYTGCNNEIEAAKFCSNNLVSTVPHDFYSEGGCMKIKLSTYGSSSKSNLGFNASYTSGNGTAIGADTDCPSYGYNSLSSGVITSPNWPLVHKKNLDTCKWTISRNSDELIQLNFMAFNLGSYMFFCSYPYLEIKGKKYYTTAFLDSKYCGSKRPPKTMNTKFYNLELKLKYGLSFSSYPGFAVGYVTYKNPNYQSVSIGVSVVKTQNAKTTTKKPQNPDKLPDAVLWGVIGTIMAVFVVIFVVTVAVVQRKKRARLMHGAAVVNNQGSAQVMINQTSTQVHPTVPTATESQKIDPCSQQPYPQQQYDQQPYPQQQYDQQLYSQQPYYQTQHLSQYSEEKPYPNFAPSPYDAASCPNNLVTNEQPMPTMIAQQPAQNPAYPPPPPY